MFDGRRKKNITDVFRQVQLHSGDGKRKRRREREERREAVVETDFHFSVNVVEEGVNVVSLSGRTCEGDERIRGMMSFNCPSLLCCFNHH